jgi:L-threonylcarbamoyladenylate synthase
MTGESIETRLIRAPRGAMDLAGLRLAADALAAGRLVAFPTETVYGLGANALDEQAVLSIYKVKGRPGDNPLIVHLAHTGLIPTVVSGIPPMAVPLIERFMPGPLTLVMRRGPSIAPSVSAGLDTVAVRCPSHPVAQAFLSMAGVPVAAPSANQSGPPRPPHGTPVREDLEGKIPFVIDGGACEVGLESTVLDVTGDMPVLLRPGAVTADQIREACGLVPRIATGTGQEPVRSPGMKYRHYAPRATVLVGVGRSLAARARHTAELVQEEVAAGHRVGVFASSKAILLIEEMQAADPVGDWPVRLVSYGELDDSVQASARLFDAFRTLDAGGVDRIVVQSLPQPHGRGPL